MISLSDSFLFKISRIFIPAAIIDPLYERIPDVPGISSLGLGNIDTVGGIALGAMAVGIAGHAATSAIQKKKRDAAEAKKSSERKDG